MLNYLFFEVANLYFVDFFIFFYNLGLLAWACKVSTYLGTLSPTRRATLERHDSDMMFVDSRVISSSKILIETQDKHVRYIFHNNQTMVWSSKAAPWRRDDTSHQKVGTQTQHTQYSLYSPWHIGFQSWPTLPLEYRRKYVNFEIKVNSCIDK